MNVAVGLFCFLVGFALGMRAMEWVCTPPEEFATAHSSTEEWSAIRSDSGSTPQAVPNDEFSATTPRHVPWSRRKKALEQQARTKRKQIESFREIA